jgi:hypothetical protein
VKNKLKDGKSLQILKLDDIDDILQRLVVKVDIVNSDYLFGILKSGD